MSDNISLDWRKIDTATPEGLRALDWEIAQRLGQQVGRPELAGAGTMRVFEADGTRLYKDWGKHPHIFFDDWHKSPEVPRYTTDLNLAWDLVKWLIPRLSIESLQYPGTYVVETIEDFRRFSHRLAHSPALACCYAFLERDDARHEQEGGA